MERAFIRLRLLLLSLLAGGLLAACAATPPPEKVRVFWPPLPDVPRLEWLKNYYSQDDLPKTDAQKATELVIGKPPLKTFNRPSGIASNRQGTKIYVADPQDRNVVVYDLVQNRVYDLTTPGTIFKAPFGLEVDSQGRLYVADTELRKVLVFSPDDQPLQVIGGPEFFGKPGALALNERLGRLYVADAKNHQVAAFDLTGKHLFSFGDKGGSVGQFNGPVGIAIAADNTLYITEQFNARVQVFDADGLPLRVFGTRGDLPVQLEGPRDIAIDSDGNLHIIDLRKAALLTFRPDGTPLLYTGSGRTGKPFGFSFPTAIWIDANDRIYIVDGLNKRFSVWQYFSEAYLATDPFGLKAAKPPVK